MKSVLDVMVSCFRNYYTPGNPVNINLLDWLLSKKYLPQIDQIRMMTEKADRDRHKANIPAITPSGTFSHKEAKGLIQHSGLIQFDIDLTKGNLEIENWSELKSEIFNFRNVAYIGLSASGMGLWGLIRQQRIASRQRMWLCHRERQDHRVLTCRDTKRPAKNLRPVPPCMCRGRQDRPFMPPQC